MQASLAALFLLSLAPFVLTLPSDARSKGKVMASLWNEANSADENQVGKRSLEDTENFWKRAEDLEGFWKRGARQDLDLLSSLREYLARREASKRGFDGSEFQKAERRRQEAAMIRPEFNPTGW